MWPFRKKAGIPAQVKGSTFLYSLTGARSSMTGAPYNTLAQDGYIECLIAFACINKIATAVSSVEPQLFQKVKRGKTNKVEDSDLLDLLDNPNPVQSGKEFMRHLASYHQLAGNAYVWGNGLDPMASKGKPPTELQLLNPGTVEVVKGPTILPLAYRYKPEPTKDATVYPVEQVTGRCAVMQLKTFHPLSHLYGISALNPAALSVDIHTSGQQWNKSLIERGARPSGAISVENDDGTPGNITDDQYNRIKGMLDEQFTGPDNTGRPLILEGGLKWQEMSINPKDMEFLNGKHSVARDIALAFGVPPQLLGIPGDSTYSNYSEAKLAFWTETVLPLLALYLEGFNRWLVPLYGKDQFLWYDEEMIPALEPLRKDKAERINAAGYMTINEKRRAMGLDDEEGGDVLLVPSTNIPIGMTMDDPEAEDKHRVWLESKGYTPERAARLAKLAHAK